MGRVSGFWVFSGLQAGLVWCGAYGIYCVRGAVKVTMKLARMMTSATRLCLCQRMSPAFHEDVQGFNAFAYEA